MPICQPIRFNFLKTRDVDWSNQVNPNLEAVFTIEKTYLGSSDNAWPSPSIGRIDLFPKGGETFSVICTSIFKDSIFQMWHLSHFFWLFQLSSPTTSYHPIPFFTTAYQNQLTYTLVISTYHQIPQHITSYHPHHVTTYNHLPQHKVSTSKRITRKNLGSIDWRMAEISHLKQV